MLISSCRRSSRGRAAGRGRFATGGPFWFLFETRLMIQPTIVITATTVAITVSASARTGFGAAKTGIFNSQTQALDLCARRHVDAVARDGRPHLRIGLHVIQFLI